MSKEETEERQAPLQKISLKKYFEKRRRRERMAKKLVEENFRMVEVVTLKPV